MARKLYVGNFPYNTTEQDLQALFAGAGTVDNVNLMRDMATGQARGFAFVEMASDEDAQKAIQHAQRPRFRRPQPDRQRGAALKGTSGGGGPGFGGGGGGNGGGGRREPRWQTRRAASYRGVPPAITLRIAAPDPPPSSFFFPALRSRLR